MARKKFVGASVRLPIDDENTVRLKAINQEIVSVEKRLKHFPQEGRTPAQMREVLKLQRTLKELQGARTRLGAPVVHVMKDREEDLETRIFERGSYQTLGEVVDYGTIDVLHEFPIDAPRNRLGLAQWLVSEENPLVARVAVNRWWAEIFGRGIVETLDDFGMQSAPPSHPELLDWLAVDFMEQGWSLKVLLRTLVNSEVYRQSAVVEPRAFEKDPENRLLWRAPRSRLPAELVRDNALSLAGLLHPKMHGPPVYPPQPEGLWQEIAGSDVKNYPTSEGDDRYRRGLYVAVRRGNPHPSMTNFDAGDRSLCVAKRPRTNTPIQALTLLNDPNFVEAAEHFAERISQHEGDAHQKARWGFRTVLAREPSEEELDVLLKLHATDSTWFDVAQTLLNTDESICN